MAAMGHEDPFLPLTARSVIRKQTVAVIRGNGRDAPTAGHCSRFEQPLVLNALRAAVKVTLPKRSSVAHENQR